MARFRPALARLFLILSILGPGFITANVDNDSGSIYTYAAAGSRFGYSLLWTIIPVAVCLTFEQEISARMGVATDKGLSELIREQYGIRVTFFLMCGLVLCNIDDVASEFAGVAVAWSCLGSAGTSRDRWLTNSRTYDLFAWSLTGVIVLLTALMLISAWRS